MKIVVTGATGFVGRHVVPLLLADGHEVAAIARRAGAFDPMPWRGQAHCVAQDIHDSDFDLTSACGVPDALVHLAWPGLPNYRERFHFERNLPADYAFLKRAVEAGVARLLVTGTGAEYGLQSGALSEAAPTDPANAYGLAKDALRRFLQMLQATVPFTLQWVRLFHMYGPGQNPGSLLAQLDRAIDNGDEVFNMSGGEQLRDYLPVEEVARRLAFLVNYPACCGVINCCAGEPVSVRRLVEQRIAERGATIRLRLGHCPYPEYETMAYWGDGSKLSRFMAEALQAAPSA